MNDVLYFFFKEMKHLFQKCPLCPKTLRDRWRTRKNDEYGKAADLIGPRIRPSWPDSIVGSDVGHNRATMAGFLLGSRLPLYM